MVVKKTNEIKEYLVVSGLGYIKVPKAIKDSYGHPSEYPNPTWKARVEKGKLLLTYSFDITDEMKRK